MRYRFYAVTESLIRNEVIYCFFNMREIFDIFENLSTKLILVISGRWEILGSSFIFATKFMFAMLCIWLIGVFGKQKLKSRNGLILRGAVSIAGWVCVFLLLKSQYSNSTSAALACIAFSTYLLNLVLNEDSRLSVAFVRRTIDCMLSIFLFVAEILFLPLFLSRAGLIRNSKVRRVFSLLYWVIVIFGSAVLITPLQSDAFYELPSLGGYEVYALKLSKKSSKLFFYSSGTPEICIDNYDFRHKHAPTSLDDRIESLNIEKSNSSFQLVYRGDHLSQFLELSDEDEELYFIDRKQRNLVIVNMNNNQVKNTIYSESFGDGGDSYLVKGEDVLYVMNEEPKYIYKIDTKRAQIIEQKPISSINSNLVFNTKQAMLYSTDIFLTDKDKNKMNSFFLSEIDGKTLKLLRRFPLAGIGTLALSQDGTKLFILVGGSIKNSLIYILDTETLAPLEKIPVFFGTRAIAVDEKRQLLIVGNTLTGLIDVINLESKKVILTYRAGNHSLREIVLDKDRRTFYVSTQYFGLYRGTY